VTVAVRARKRQVVLNRFAAVLLSAHVIDLKVQRKGRFREATIFAAVARSLADEPRQLPVHCWLACFKIRRALDCQTATRLPTCM